MSVHSVMTGEDAAASSEATEPAPLPEGLTLYDAQFEPAAAEPGETVLLSVAVHDPEKRVDTVAATFRDIQDATLDLFDNGTQGDRTIGDGIWSRRVPVFPQMQAGQHVLEITAYDVNGNQIANEDGSPLQTDAVFTVAPK